MWGFQEGMQWLEDYGKKINDGIKNFLATKLTLNNIQRKIQDLSQNVKDVIIKLSCRNHSRNSVKIKEVLIKTNSCHYDIIKHVFKKLRSNFLGNNCRIILKCLKREMEKKRDRDIYNDGLAKHNHFTNTLCAIPLQGIPKEGFKLPVSESADDFPEPSIPVTFETFFKRSCKAISIKQTKETKEKGTYQIIFKDKHYEVLTKHLKKLFNAFVMNDDHLVTKKAKEQWGHTPCIDLLFNNSESEL